MLKSRTRSQSLVVLTALVLTACYASILRRMFQQWSSDDDMSHGFLVPVVIAWILWRERERWSVLPLMPSIWGFPIMITAAGMHLVGALGGGLFAAAVGFVLSVAGAVLCLGGFALLRAWAFPLLLALFMLPKLAIVYNQATLPLQLLASRLAVALLSLGWAGIIREGNILDVGGHRVLVAEACNGIRYLLSLGFVAVVFAYVVDSKPWMRLALLVTAVPVAILANAMRVAAAAALPALDAGAPHAVAGWFLFMLCLAALILMRRLFNAVYARYHV